MPVPASPSAATLFPVAAPVVAPARRCVGTPAVEIRGWMTVITDRNAQDIQRHLITIHQVPRSVVPAARIPVVILEYPVQTIVEEDIHILPGGVVDGVAWHPDKPRIRRKVDADADAGHVDADADADLGTAQSQRDKQHRQYNKQVAHFLASWLKNTAARSFNPVCIRGGRGEHSKRARDADLE